MANTKSALKRIGTSEKRHVRNQAVKSETRTYVKKARTAIVQNPDEAREQLLAAISALDRAARKHVIHPNNAARRKSRLVKRYNSATAVIVPAEEKPEAAPAPKKRRAKTATAAATPKTAPKAAPKRRSTKKESTES